MLRDESSRRRITEGKYLCLSHVFGTCCVGICIRIWQDTRHYESGMMSSLLAFNAPRSTAAIIEFSEPCCGWESLTPSSRKARGDVKLLRQSTSALVGDPDPSRGYFNPEMSYPDPRGFQPPGDSDLRIKNSWVLEYLQVLRILSRNILDCFHLIVYPNIYVM